MRIDATPMHKLGTYTVLQERHEILFRDDSTVGLHLVVNNGVPSVFLRCLVHDELHALVFDLRDLSRTLGTELLTCPERDQRGLVFMTLRLRYASATELQRDAIAVVRAAALLPATPREPRQLTFFSTSGAVDALGPDTADRRFWPIRLDARAYA